MLLYPKDLVRHFHFGYNEVVSDLQWVRLLQDFDLCEQALLKPGEPRTGHDRRTADCVKGWVYWMLDSITTLAPRNRLPYDAGATVLMVIVDDIEGARLIFEKGLEQFPNDWILNYRLAYLYFKEIGDNAKAAKHFQIAGDNGAPEWVMSLSARLYSEKGRLEFAKSMLVEFLKKAKDPRWIKRIKERILEIDEKIKNQ